MKLILVILLTLFFASCTEKVTEVNYNFSWELYYEGYFDFPTNTILNSYTSDLNELIIANQYNFFKMNESYYAIPFVSQVFLPYQLKHKPVIDDSFIYYLSPDLKNVAFQSHSEPYSYDIFYNNEYHDCLEIASIDSSFNEDSGVVILHGRTQNFCASNNDGEIVFVAGNFSFDAIICRINFHVEDNVCIIDSIQTTPILLWFYSYFGTYFFNGYYYILTLDGGCLIVNPDNSVEGIFISPFDFFEYNNKFWSLTTNTGDRYQLLNTEDGQNWTSVISFNEPFKVAQINDKMIGFIGYNIFEIDLENERIYYLDNTGLVHNEISSINLYNEKIYVSTYNGLFYRDYSDFYKGRSTNPLPTNDMNLMIVDEEE
jgi:hypothetical protein